MNRTKFPRTPHLPWSLGATSDDKTLSSIRHFEKQEIVITEKIDGENTTVYPDGYCHARSTDSNHHPSRSWMKAFVPSFCHQIPEGHRICGENVFAYHSIYYRDLPSYFLVFAIYDQNNNSLRWSDVESICQILDLCTAPVLYRGLWNTNLVKALWTGKGTYPTFSLKNTPPVEESDFVPCDAEGYVVRLERQFHYGDFGMSTAKWVREGHVTTDTHWMARKPIPNELRKTS